MKEDSPEKKIILVDEEDQEIGIESKLKVHQLGLLHRAYSIFIFRKNKNALELLLQQRAQHKYHCGGLWSNTCCSHPEPLCDIQSHAMQRLYEEMGIRGSLEKVGVFSYRAEFLNGLIEHEVDHLFIGYTETDEIFYNKEEVMSYRFEPLDRLICDIEANPQHYTPWFLPALKIIYAHTPHR